MSSSDRVVIAQIVKPHGVRGELRVNVFNSDTNAIMPKAKLLLTLADKEKTQREVTVEYVRSIENPWIVALVGIEDRDTAETLRNAELSILRSDLPEPEEGEFYHADAVGCSVYDTNNQLVGLVKEVQRYPSVDVLVVE